MTRQALLLAALLLACRAQELPTIRVPVRLVSLPTLVFDGENKLLSGLEPADFRVLDNGHLQTVRLDSTASPVSLAVAVQVNQDVREYVPFIAKVGSVLEALVAGETGETAVVSYRGDVDVVKPFGAGDLAASLAKIDAHGRQARMIDGALRALGLLRDRRATRARFLLLIGQPMDNGSESTLDALKEEAARDNVTVYAVTLPQIHKAFVSDTFLLEGLSSRADRGGFRASADLIKLIPTLSHASAAMVGTDPFSVLTAATGGTQFHIRKQRELEFALSTMGVELRSEYLLSYTPTPADAGYHAIQVEIDHPGAKAYARPGYWLDGN